MVEQITCSWVDEHISPYLRNELDGTSRTAFETHASTCPDCARLITALRALQRTHPQTTEEPLDEREWNEVVDRSLQRCERYLAGQERNKDRLRRNGLGEPIVLPLGSPTAASWPIGDVPCMVHLEAYDVELECQITDAPESVRAVVLAESDPHFALVPSCWALAAAGQDDSHHTQGVVVFPNGRLERFEMTQTRTGDIVLRLLSQPIDLCPIHLICSPRIDR